jgi:hypothetical protein
MKTFLKCNEFVFSGISAFQMNNTVQYLLGNPADRFEPGGKGRGLATPLEAGSRLSCRDASVTGQAHAP